MAENREAELVWKPKATLGASLFFLLVSVFFWGLLFFGADSDKSLSNWILTSVYFFPALFGTIYSVRTRVEATENGVRWRDWRGTWRAAKWEEIRDFYKRTKSESGSTHTVETSQGNLAFGLEGDGRAIAQLIAERAVNAPVREWEIHGERLLIDEWPRRFMFFHSGLDFAARNTFLVLLATIALTIYILWFRLPPRAGIFASSFFWLTPRQFY